jgi:hypothetical protein
VSDVLGTEVAVTSEEALHGSFGGVEDLRARGNGSHFYLRLKSLN